MKSRILKKAVETAHALCPTNWKNVNNSHIAFLVKKNKIVKIGWNRKRTHSERITKYDRMVQKSLSKTSRL